MMTPESRRETKRVVESLDEHSRASKLSKSPPKLEGSIEEKEGEEEVERTTKVVIAGMSCTTPSIQRYLVAVEYIGTGFSGSQRQTNCRTVTGVLEKAFHKFVGQPVVITFSSRTDAGVHAVSNVFHVDVERISKRRPGEVLPPHEPGVVKRAVNHFLQKDNDDIMVIDVREVAADFHARFKALERTYFYRLLCGPESLSSFEKERAWHVSEDLDLYSMKKACSILIGRHDFSSFRASGCQANSPIKTLEELNVTEVPSSLYFPSAEERVENKCDNKPSLSSCEPSKEHLNTSHMMVGNSTVNRGQGFGCKAVHRCYVVTARARSFLYHQVRLLVGVLKCVGTGAISVSEVEKILLAKNVTAANPMAPACGLYLGNVRYDL